MKPIGFAITVLMLAGCARTTNGGTPIVTNGTLTGFISEVASPGSTYKQREIADDKKCHEYGFKKGTDAYANCRLRLDQARAGQRNSIVRSAQQMPPSDELSLLCRDAIARGDKGAMLVHC